MGAEAAGGSRGLGALGIGPEQGRLLAVRRLGRRREVRLRVVPGLVDDAALLHALGECGVALEGAELPGGRRYGGWEAWTGGLRSRRRRSGLKWWPRRGDRCVGIDIGLLAVGVPLIVPSCVHLRALPSGWARDDLMTGYMSVQFV